MMRIAMYVDGWNFYYSLAEASIKQYGWCNFPILATQQTFLSDAEVSVKYFTSADQPHKEKITDRQKPIWWRALKLMGCQIIEGEFRSTTEEVEEHIKYGKKQWREKRTDIELACHMLSDCIRVESEGTSGTFRWMPSYDIAVLLTQDTDFVPLVRTVSRPPFDRQVRVLLPPSNTTVEENAYRTWDREAKSTKVVIKQLRIGDLARALLPRVVKGPNGQEVECHHSWMWREKYEDEVARAKARAKSAKAVRGR